MDFQQQFDALAAHVREQRSAYHLTLGELIDALADVDDQVPVVVDRGGGVGRLVSYRGYYADLAFVPIADEASTATVRTAIVGAVGATFEGYKGGDFLMDRDAPLWIAADGDVTGIAVVGVDVIGGLRVRLVTKVVPA